MDLQIPTLILLFLIAVVFILSRCMRKSFGQLEIDQDVGMAFRQGMVRDHRIYYISGSGACPRAIMGIDKAWDLESDLWKPIELTPAFLEELARPMRTRYGSLYGLPDRRSPGTDDWRLVFGPGYSGEDRSDRARTGSPFRRRFRTPHRENGRLRPSSNIPLLPSQIESSLFNP